MSEDIPLDVASVSIDATFPCDARFRSMMDAVAAKAVSYFGLSETSADGIRTAVTTATTGVLAHPDGASYTSLAVRLATEDGSLRVDVRYLVESPDGAAGPGTALEQILSDGRNGEPPIEAMRRVASRVEIGEVDGAECCTIVTPLPSES